MDLISIQIIKKMHRKKYWGHRMINQSDLISYVPRLYRKKAKGVVESLVKKGFLNKKQGIKQEFRYSLSLSKKEEIDKVLNNNTTFIV